MEKQTLKPFFIAGIFVRTSNANGQAVTDIPALWDRFRSEDIAGQLKGRLSDEVYSVYTEYDGDHTQPYTTVIGYAVENNDHLPEGIKGFLIGGGPYEKYTAKGVLSEGIVFDAWVNIWNSDIPRAYTADFEVYGAKAQDPENAVVDIFIAVK